jgi:acyl-CoA thioesterase-2
MPVVHQTGPHQWRTDEHITGEGLIINPTEGLYRVDGGETVAHSMWMAEAEHPGRRCLSVSSLFTREGRHDGPTDYEVTPLHSGRNFASVSVRASQPARGIIADTQLVLVGELVGPSHQAAQPPDVDWSHGIDDLADLVSPPVRVIGRKGIGDPQAGEPELRLVLPIPTGLTDALDRRMYIAYATDHLLIAAALSPHAGIGYRTKHEFYTAVLAHSLRFWRDVEPGTELRFDIISPVMADSAGIAIGHAFDAGGGLVATCIQDVVARPAG